MTRIFKINTLLFLFLCPVYFANAQNSDLLGRIHNIIDHKNATVGVAVEGYNAQDTFTVNGNQRFPMHSVFKYHIAATVLHEVDKGNLKLNQEFEIGKKDLANNSYSPIRDKYPNGTTMNLSEVIRYAVSESDNIACDLLLKLISGPKTVENYMHGNGIQNIAIKYNEAAQESKWENQYENWITPTAANLSLKVFFENSGLLLSKKSHKFLWDAMIATKTGEKRIRKNLPAGTTIAHKTGSSGKNASGITGACNDIGIIFLPGGKYFYLSVFITNSKESEEENEKLISAIAETVWTYFQEKYK